MNILLHKYNINMVQVNLTNICSNSNIDMYHFLTKLDGIPLVNGNVILLRNQHNICNNGLFKVVTSTSGPSIFKLKRLYHTKKDSLLCFVINGTQSKNKAFIMLSKSSIVIPCI